MKRVTKVRLWLVSSVAFTVALTIIGTAVMFNPNFNTMNEVILVAVLSIAFGISWKQYFKHLGVNE